MRTAPDPPTAPCIHNLSLLVRLMISSGVLPVLRLLRSLLCRSPRVWLRALPDVASWLTGFNWWMAQWNAQGAGDRPVALTGVERDAVFELGVRPTLAVDRRAAVDGDVELMLANAALWTQAARITSAGRTGVISGEVRVQIVALLDAAIPEALADLEQTRRARDQWRAGAAGLGFPGLDAGETEARYAAELDRGRRVHHGLNSLAAKLGLPGTQPPGIAAPALSRAW